MLKTVMVVLLMTTACGKSKGGGGDAIGIAECDDYVTKAMACAGKLGAKGDSLKRQTTSIADAWRKQAGDSSLKAEMGKTCSEASEAAKKVYTDCAF